MIVYIYDNFEHYINILIWKVDVTKKNYKNLSKLNDVGMVKFFKIKIKVKNCAFWELLDEIKKIIRRVLKMSY